MEFEEVLDELYREPPDGFVARRDEQARAAKGSGDAALARRISALHRPTVSAWLVNRLVREDRPAVEQLLALGAQLREASGSLDAESMRTLSRERHTVVAALGRQAAHSGQAAGGRVTADAVRELEQTLEAALSDEDAAQQLLGGALVKPLEYAGFGPALGASAAPRPRVAETKARESAGGDKAARGQAARERAAREEAAREETARRQRELARAEQELTSAEDTRRACERELHEAREDLTRLRTALADGEARETHAREADSAAAARLQSAQVAVKKARERVT
ncbi:MAG: hypothetical protein JWM71_2056 [Solirubrobacteraceae bacterium]|nr:hypothetical protein [Solirubrobacteraceae bacterium]